MITVTDPTIVPQPGCQVNWSHPISRDLVFCALPGYGIELVGGNRSDQFTNGFVDGTSRQGRSLRSSSVTNGGQRFPFTNQLSRATGDITILCWARLDTLSAHGKLICLPFRSAGWTSPFVGFAFGRDSSTSSGKLDITRLDNSIINSANSEAGYLLTGATLNQYAVSREMVSDAVIFYRNGSRYGVSRTTGAANQAIHMTNRQPVCLFQRSATSNGEGLAGIMSIAAIWARVLSAEEIRSLFAQPYQFLQDGLDYRYFI